MQCHSLHKCGEWLSHYFCQRKQSNCMFQVAAGSTKSSAPAPNHTSALLNGNYEMRGVSKATPRRLLPAFYKSRQPRSPRGADSDHTKGILPSRFGAPISSKRVKFKPAPIFQQDMPRLRQGVWPAGWGAIWCQMPSLLSLPLCGNQACLLA